MLIGLIGESCTGKTTLANKIKDSLGAEIYSGKDYLRLSKNENDAKKLFVQKSASCIIVLALLKRKVPSPTRINAVIRIIPNKIPPAIKPF